MKRIRYLAWPPALQESNETLYAVTSALIMEVLLLAAAIAIGKDNLGIGIPLIATAVFSAGFGFSGVQRLQLRRWRCLKRLATGPNRCVGRIVAIETVELPKGVVAEHPDLRAVTVWHRGQQLPAHEDARDFLVQPGDGTAPARVEACDLTVLVSAAQRVTRYAGLAADEHVVVVGDVSHETHPIGDTGGYREPPKRAVYSNAIALQVTDLDAVIPVHRPLIITVLTLALFAFAGVGGFLLFTRALGVG